MIEFRETLVGGLVILGIFLGLYVYKAYEVTQFVKGGYCETTAVGSTATMWVKCPAVPR